MSARLEAAMARIPYTEPYGFRFPRRSTPHPMPDSDRAVLGRLTPQERKQWHDSVARYQHERDAPYIQDRINPEMERPDYSVGDAWRRMEEVHNRLRTISRARGLARRIVARHASALREEWVRRRQAGHGPSQYIEYWRDAVSRTERRIRDPFGPGIYTDIRAWPVPFPY